MLYSHELSLGFAPSQTIHKAATIAHYRTVILKLTGEQARLSLAHHLTDRSGNAFEAWSLDGDLRATTDW